MKIPSFRRIFSTDFAQQYKDLVDTLAVSLNNGLDVLYQTLQKNVTLRDNVKCSIKDLVLIVNSSGIPTQGGTFLLDYSDKVDILDLGYISNQTNSSSYPSSGVTLTWTQTGKTIIINHLTGLTAGNTYSLRIVAYHQ